MERALLDAASWPKLVGGASRIAESLAAVMAIKGLAELAHAVSAEAGYRRIGSISTALSLAVGHGLEPEPWRTLVDLDTTAQHEHGWVDRTWGVAWPYPVSQLEAAVAS
jgi:predicted 3-demethylubiquinone-9 3-methyltransferase (glyoxalase superfamily)